MVVLRTCCGCCSLRAGCIIIGALMIIGGLQQLSDRTFRGVFGTILGLLLIYGAISRNRLCLWPVILVNILGTVFLTIVVIIFAFAKDTFGQDSEIAKLSGTESVTFIVVCLIAIAYVVFCILVIYGYVCELREEEQRHIIMPTTTNIPSPHFIIA